MACASAARRHPDKTKAFVSALSGLCQGFVRTETLKRQGLQPIPDKMTKQTQPFFGKKCFSDPKPNSPSPFAANGKKP
jgi:hypothetical protein